MGDFLEFAFGIAALFGGVILAIFLCIMLYSATAGRWACAAMPEQYGVETRYNIWNGCAVKTEQGWIPESAWAKRDIKERHEVTVK